MGRFNRGIMSRGRNHHGVQGGLNSMYFNGIDDFQVFGHYAPNDHDANLASGANTATLWRLPNSLHKNNSNTNYDWSADQNNANFGETPMSCAFWVKIYPDASNYSYGNMPIISSNPNYYDSWRPIWASSWDMMTNETAGIFVALAYEANGPSGGKANYFLMGKGGGTTGTAGKQHRTGTTTPVYETAFSSGDYQAQWFHVACVWNDCDPVGPNNGWQMWVNGVLQTNNFDSSNGFHRNGELSSNAYSNITGLGVGFTGTFAMRNQTYLEMGLTDFGYWHAPLNDDDVSALWNNGNLSNRAAPTANISSTW